MRDDFSQSNRFRKLIEQQNPEPMTGYLTGEEKRCKTRQLLFNSCCLNQSFWSKEKLMFGGTSSFSWSTVSNWNHIYTHILNKPTRCLLSYGICQLQPCNLKYTIIYLLGGGFKFQINVFCPPLFGEDFQFDLYVSDGWNHQAVCQLYFQSKVSS